MKDPAAVLVGSTAAVFGEAGHADYAAAKAGMTYGLARSLKNEICRLAPRGRVNVVCPFCQRTLPVEDYAIAPYAPRAGFASVAGRLTMFATFERITTSRDSPERIVTSFSFR